MENILQSNQIDFCRKKVQTAPTVAVSRANPRNRPSVPLLFSSFEMNNFCLAAAGCGCGSFHSEPFKRSCCCGFNFLLPYWGFQ